MLKFLLTDGRGTYTMAVELDRLTGGISTEATQPGSKLLLKGVIEVKRGLYMLKNPNVELVYGYSSPGFKTSGLTSFNKATDELMNPKSLERKGML